MSAAPDPSARQVLEPCPFCGSAHVDVVMFETHHNEMWHRAECQNCMAKSSGSKYPALAIAAWNRRAAPDRAAIVEECAQVADRRDDEGEYGHYTAFIARRIAEDIRALCAASLRARAEALP